MPAVPCTRPRFRVIALNGAKICSPSYLRRGSAACLVLGPSTGQARGVEAVGTYSSFTARLLLIMPGPCSASAQHAGPAVDGIGIFGGSGFTKTQPGGQQRHRSLGNSANMQALHLHLKMSAVLFLGFFNSNIFPHDCQAPSLLCPGQ